MPSALLMYELALQMNKRRNDLLWLAIVGVTEHLLEEHFKEKQYEPMFQELQSEVLGLNTESPSSRGPAGKDGQIACVEEYRFMLYRHWTLFDSMYHSPFIATKLGTWVNETSGKQKLDTMLVGMGIPKRESSEKFQHMSKACREKLKDKLDKAVDAHGLPPVTYGSFTIQTDYNPPVSAADVVYAVTALLTCPKTLADAEESLARSSTTGSAGGGAGAGPGAGAGAGGGSGAASDVPASGLTTVSTSWRACFDEAYSCLARFSTGLLFEGIKHAMHLQKAIVRLAPTLHARRGLWSAGFMRVLKIDEFTENDQRLFTQPLALARLGRYLIDMHQETEKKWLGARAKPLVIQALDTSRRVYVVVGLPCTESKDTVEKTNFMLAFSTAASETDAHYTMDGFDACVMEIEQDDILRFTDYLQHRLAHQ